MCDYSRRFPCSQVARIGDKLITTRIGATCGFAAADDHRIGICLKPGTELAFDRPVEILTLFGRWFSRWLNQDKQRCVALFRQKTVRGHRYDLLEFPDGPLERMAWLYEGQTATVLQLPAPAPTRRTSLKRRNNRRGKDLQVPRGSTRGVDPRQRKRNAHVSPASSLEPQLRLVEMQGEQQLPLFNAKVSHSIDEP